MTKGQRVSGAIVILLVAGAVAAGDPVDDSELGLSKTSVFDTPSPEAFTYTESFPGTNEALPRAYTGAPPQIPHRISNYVPVTAKSNQCLGCHDKPELIGKATKGLPTPMPKGHYAQRFSLTKKSPKTLDNAIFVCTQCHVPQADVKPLVENMTKNLTR
jgi:nitrate reductase (cytochrome), electron transfer subunit